MAKPRWITRSVLGIVLATFFSDVSHEMATAVLPFYLGSIGLGIAALGFIEGIADFFVSLSKLGGGYLGHRVKRKKPWASLGYLATAICTASIGLASTLGAIVSLRTGAWISRGFRSPLRDYLLSDAVEPTHYGRAFGLERAGDMLGAVTGPLFAAGAIAIGLGYRELILWTIIPGALAAAALFFITKERVDNAPAPAIDATIPSDKPRFPRAFWMLLIAVMLFGLGDFSRTFLIWIAARSLDGGAGGTEALDMSNILSISIIMYAGHNLVAAIAAYPAGHLGDRFGRRGVLLVGYAIGIGVNVLLAVASMSVVAVVVAIVFSGIYISIQETVEKAVAAEILPRELRSLGFGILACGNAVGDMASSIYVGLLLHHGYDFLAFAIAAGFGIIGFVALIVLVKRNRLAKRAS